VLGCCFPLIGIIFGHVLSRSWQLKQWQIERRWQDYQAVMTAIATAYMAMIRLYDLETALSASPEIRDEVNSIKHDSFRVIRDRITIATELESNSILDDWAAAVMNYEADTREVKRFAKRFSDINERLVRMARNHPPGKAKQVCRWLNWWVQYRWAKLRKRV
jgi:hypothetical protein